MKNKFITPIILLFFLFVCSRVYAENFPSKDSSAEIDYYGQVDAVYSEELRVIIGDISFNYNTKSLFLDRHGNTLINIDRSIKNGMYVKYHVSPISDSSFVIIDLKVIPENEYNSAVGELRVNDD